MNRAELLIELQRASINRFRVPGVKALAERICWAGWAAHGGFIMAENQNEADMLLRFSHDCDSMSVALQQGLVK